MDKMQTESKNMTSTNIESTTTNITNTENSKINNIMTEQGRINTNPNNTNTGITTQKLIAFCLGPLVNWFMKINKKWVEPNRKEAE